MKKNLFSLTLLIVASLLSLLSCTANMDIKTKNSPPVIVIYGYITSDYIKQTIHISSSAPYFSAPQDSAVSGAQVEIVTSGNKTYPLYESNIKGEYVSTTPFAGKPGETYQLTVKVDFNKDGSDELYQAKTTMPDSVKLDSIFISPLKVMTKDFYNMAFYMQDPTETNYYYSLVYVNDTLSSYNITRSFIFNDKVFNGDYIKGSTFSYFPDGNHMDEFSSKKNDLVFMKKNDKVSLALANVEKGFYDFISQCQKEKNGSNPFFGGPASNITTNLSNGAVGYFSSFSLSRATTKIK